MLKKYCLHNYLDPSKPKVGDFVMEVGKKDDGPKGLEGDF